MIRTALLFAFAAAAPLAQAAAPAPLSTIAERSAFQSTGRYDEVVALCARFQQAYPKAARCFEYGRTPEGRPMLALAVSRSGALTAQQARQRGLPVLLVQGGIHAGEIDGKDAGFLALREALENQAAPGALDRQVLLFVPVFNVDGHERFGQWNRPNQRGPVAMGWRTTAQNYNLNRDYVKAEAPEMQAMLALVNQWDPLACIDLHVTDGAKFQPDVSIQVEPVHGGDAALRQAGAALRDNVIADLKRQGSDPRPYYMSFAETDDPASGFIDQMSPPRFSTGYFMLRNRMAMLVETHSWKNYPARVRVTRNTVLSVMAQVAAHGKDWLRMAHEADARGAMLAGAEVPQSYRTTYNSKTVDFPGYAYTRSHSDVSGALMTHYDETRPQTWSVPLRDEIVPDLQVRAPRGGYLVPVAQAAAVAAKLRLHGIAYKVLGAALDNAAVEAFRADQATLAAQSFEGRQSLKVEGAWRDETRSLARGALFVPIAQPKARLLMTLLEPRNADSLLAWGFFNNAFERKEYMEAYVAEDVARDQLAADPALAAAFRDKLAADAAFAASPEARLEFFARRHASWDERYRLYPVLRTASTL
ncbi:MAG TPA: M14 family metallopeptidase [Burkholderiaceae bacterium]|nr:M14 family metallopeptidase [Burkholderiaceae bacterium]